MLKKALVIYTKYKVNDRQSVNYLFQHVEIFYLKPVDFMDFQDQLSQPVPTPKKEGQPPSLKNTNNPLNINSFTTISPG